MIAHVAAQAKINLDLRILAREDSGYHQLETVFQRIDLADQVRITLSPGAGVSVEQTPATEIPPDTNLAVRAARAYAAVNPWVQSRHVHIEITKRIPIGGGLGGGSANAAAVLRILQSLVPTPLVQDALLTLASSLGADVPFLASECVLALAWGRGERCIALPPLVKRALALVLSDSGVSTPEAFRWLASAREAGRVPSPGAHVHAPDAFSSWGAIAEYSRNDFESVVFSARADLAADFARLTATEPLLARMSGSGATLVAVYDGAPPASIVALHGRLLPSATAARVAAVVREA
jgi:4-diphosphocytidyl-2-C-methyl-D-erythritol kinase